MPVQQLQPSAGMQRVIDALAPASPPSDDPDQMQLMARSQSLDGAASPSLAGGPPLSSSDRDLLIKTVYGEARGEPDAGKAAIVHAILNRVAAGGYGQGISGVVLAPAAGVNPARGYHEFSPWNPPGVPEGQVAKLNALPTADPNSYARIGDIVDKVYSGLIPDQTGGATHYYGGMPRPPSWAAPLAAQNQVRIGNTTFVGGMSGPGQTQPSLPIGGPITYG